MNDDNNNDNEENNADVLAAIKTQCPKCDAHVTDLPRHLKQRKSCIGAWYVCKRCTEPFETESKLTRHQSRKQVCQLRPKTPASGLVPKELAASLRYQKAIYDNNMNGDPIDYLRRAIKRRDPIELANVLEAATLTDLEVLFLCLQRQANRDNQQDYNVLGLMSDYANGGTVSLEKRALIRNFVDQNVSL